MKSVLLASLLVVTVMGFGGSLQGATNACEECLCAHDEQETKKCCASQGSTADMWDGFCDALALIACKVECTDEEGDPDASLLPHLHGLTGRHAGQDGEICGQETFEGNHEEHGHSHATCAEGLICHQASADSDIRVCESFDDALSNLAEYEDAHDHDHVLDDLTPHDHLDAAFGFHSEEVLTEEELQEELERIAEQLGVEVSDLEIVQTESPTRRQVRQQRYSYQVRASSSSQYSNSQTSSSNSLPCKSQACNKMSAAKTTEYTTMIDNMGVKLIGWDWDLTAHTYHTYGKTYGSYNDIARTISQHFVAVAKQWCEQNKPQAIVTYSNSGTSNLIKGLLVPGTQMIQEVLRRVLGEKCASKMPVYGRNDSQQQGAGKTWHLESAQRRFGVSNNNAVILVDDTASNINEALPRNYQTIFVTPNDGFDSNTGQVNTQAKKAKGSW